MRSAREKLVQEFAARRKRNPRLSLRGFSRWLGMSPAQVSQMMAGKRKITQASVERLSEKFALSPGEKRSLAASLLKGVEAVRWARLDEDRFRLIADWPHLAILALTRTASARPDARWVARRLGISSEGAIRALQRLERLGLLRTHPKFEQVGEPFEVASETPSAAIRKYHRQVLELAIDKLETVPPAARQFQSICVPMGRAKLERLKQLVDQFIADAAGEAEASSAEELFQVSVQVFPVTRAARKERT